MTDKTDVWMPLWIGAYTADTMMLTTLQHGAYLLLLMAYWRERAPLPDDDEALRSIAKMSRQEWTKARPTLAKKFKVAEGVWWHKRVEAEMAAADARAEKASEKASRAAGARWKKDREHPAGNAPSMPGALPEQVHEECPPPSPSSLRSEPSFPSGRKGARKRAEIPPCPDGVTAQTWGDWLALRAKKRAAVSQTVLVEAGKEAAKAGMPLEAFLRAWCLRGSQGMQADWLRPSERGAVVPITGRQKAIEEHNRAVGEQWVREQEAMDASR